MKLLSLTPSFSRAQDGPSFVLTFQNDTAAPLNLLESVEGLSLLLDGKPYRNQVIKFAGNIWIAPGATHSIDISPDAYPPTAQRQGYSPVLKRWRWNLLLNSGKHALVVRMGNSQIGPVEFVWNAEVPLLYR